MRVFAGVFVVFVIVRLVAELLPLFLEQGYEDETGYHRGRDPRGG